MNKTEKKWKNIHEIVQRMVKCNWKVFWKHQKKDARTSTILTHKSFRTKNSKTENMGEIDIKNVSKEDQ